MITMLRLKEAALSAGRDLARRRVGLALLIGLPLAFYLSSLNAVTIPGHLPFKVTAGTLGMSWAIGNAAFFLMTGARGVDERLVLAGYAPWQLLFGRLALLLAFTTVLVGLFGAVLLSTTNFREPALALVALLAVGIAAVPLGLAIAAVVPGELEGTLVLIAVVGIQMSPTIPSWMPSAGSVRLADVAWRGSGEVAAPLITTALWSCGLLAASIIMWRQRLPRARRQFANPKT